MAKNRSPEPAGPNLLICGTGMHWRQMTREVEEALRGCRVVFFQGGNDTLGAHLKSLTPRLEEFSFARSPFFSADEEEKQLLPLAPVFAALDEEGPVGVVLPGHAAFLDGITRFLIRGCRERKKSWRVYDGVSSFDSLIRSLGLDLCGSGMQLADASAVLKGWPLDPRQPAMLFRPAAPFLPEGKTPAKVLRLLLRRLRKDYPPGHAAFLVSCFSGEGDEAVKFPLRELPRKARWIAARHATLLLAARGACAAPARGLS